MVAGRRSTSSPYISDVTNNIALSLSYKGGFINSPNTQKNLLLRTGSSPRQNVLRGGRVYYILRSSVVRIEELEYIIWSA